MGSNPICSHFYILWWFSLWLYVITDYDAIVTLLYVDNVTGIEFVHSFMFFNKICQTFVVLNMALNTSLNYLSNAMWTSLRAKSPGLWQYCGDWNLYCHQMHEKGFTKRLSILNGLIMWGSTFRTYLSKLTSLQNKAVKWRSLPQKHVAFVQSIEDFSYKIFVYWKCPN